MNTIRRGHKLLAIAAASALVIAACGSDDNGGSSGTTGNTTGETTAETTGDTTAATTGDTTADTTGDTTASTDGESAGGSGGDFVDLGTFVGDPPEHIDPALNTTLSAFQVNGALYDGLTDIDFSDPENSKVVPLVADEITPNDDASVWTFHIREGAQFSDGSEINASTFQKSWERVADLAGDYSYLLTFIEGGQARLDGDADTISGVEADDATRTLTVTLSAPYSNFDAVAGFQLFYPMPDEAIDAGADYENQIMIGNGPYAMERERSDQEIDLIRNDNWQGDFNGDTWEDRLDSIAFRVQADPDTAYNAFEAGEGDDTNIPPGRVADAQANWGTTLDTNMLGVYYFEFNDRDPIVGGDANLKLRQAISAAIDRADINEAVYNGSRTLATGITPPGIPGFKDGLCDYCTYDPDQAQTLFDEWTAAGNSLDKPIPIQFNADVGHEPVVQIMIDNLAAIGIDAEAQPFPSETYFSELADGACVFCRAGWFADYPTYDNFMFDLFHSSSLGGNNYGFDNADFDKLVDDAKANPDKDAAATEFQQAEDILLNKATNAVPINWYRGTYAYDQSRISNFIQTPQGQILWEQIKLSE